MLPRRLARTGTDRLVRNTLGSVDVTLLYFEDCPNWRIADERLAALTAERPEIRVTRHLVDTEEEAERLRFHGSPSILVDGVDVFAEPDDPVGLSCRRYPTPDGYQGAPTLAQLVEALGAGVTAPILGNKPWRAVVNEVAAGPGS